MQKRHRIFIAINLPADVKKRLARYQEKWQDVPAKWTAPDNIHITLVFLGDITDEELAGVCKVVKDFSGKHDVFNLSLNKIAYGPEGKIPPRYIWAGGDRSEDLKIVREDLENELSEIVKLKPDKNEFTPHITLARIKEWEWRAINPEEQTEVNEDIELTFTVDSIDVMESELTRQGPRYVIIESHPLS